MSVTAYLGKVRELQLKGWSLPASRVNGPVLEGRLSIEGALAEAALSTRRLNENGRPDAAYASVAHYDPVLRSHCRLDREG